MIYINIHILYCLLRTRNQQKLFYPRDVRFNDSRVRVLPTRLLGPRQWSIYRLVALTSSRSLNEKEKRGKRKIKRVARNADSYCCSRGQPKVEERRLAHLANQLRFQASSWDGQNGDFYIYRSTWRAKQVETGVQSIKLESI